MSYAVDHDDTEDRYHTQVDAGDVRLFTLDQLDAAFNAGLIHENTYVCLEGGNEWLTLGEVAGLGDEEPEPAPAPVAHRGGFAASPSVVPAAPYSVAPMVMPNSLRPVVNDLSFDDFDPDMAAMRPKRRAGKVVAGLAVVALGALGFVAVQSGGIKLPKLDMGGVGQASAASLSLGGTKDTKPAPKMEAPAPAPEPAKPEPPKVEESKPTETAAATTDSKDSDAKTEKKADDRFSEDMKAALLNKDKKQASTQKQKKAARGAVAAKARKPGKAGKASTGFKSGGSAYDPLNAKL